MAANIARTYDRLASPSGTAAISHADGGGVIAAKDRPGDLSGASDQEVVARAVAGEEAAFRAPGLLAPLPHGARPRPRRRPGPGDVRQGPERDPLLQPAVQVLVVDLQDREQRRDRSPPQARARDPVARRLAPRAERRRRPFFFS